MADSAESRWRLLGVGLVVLVVQAVATYCGWIFFNMHSMSFVGCGDYCNFELLNFARQTQHWVGTVSLVAAFIALVLLAFKGREAWWAPAIGLSIILVTTICTTIAISIGAQHPDALGSLVSLTT